MIFSKTTLITSVLLFGTLPVLALPHSKFLPGYEISSEAKKVYQNNSTTTGASRSDCENPLKGKSLNLVVPKESVVHLTASNNPSFNFFSEGAVSEPLIFTLVDLDRIEPLVEEPLMISQAGYHKISLPPDIKLEAGKIYIWNIAIPCSDDPESFADVLRAAVKYVPPSAELLQKIQNANSPEEKSQIYTDEGMWYDAVNLLNLDEFGVQSSLQN